MTAPAKTIVRPLSPHLQVYRLPLAAVLSITHRITGVGLVLGMAMVTWWVVAAAYGPRAFEPVEAFTTSWIGQVILFGFSVSLFFHLCNGIRHLVWDSGVGFEKRDTAVGNAVVLASTLLLTVVAWLLAYI
jgi:succinate dehydrogenase / fumarate reductase, cytochrome b subunit